MLVNLIELTSGAPLSQNCFSWNNTIFNLILLIKHLSGNMVTAVFWGVCSLYQGSLDRMLALEFNVPGMWWSVSFNKAWLGLMQAHPLLSLFHDPIHNRLAAYQNSSSQIGVERA